MVRKTHNKYHTNHPAIDIYPMNEWMNEWMKVFHTSYCQLCHQKSGTVFIPWIYLHATAAVVNYIYKFGVRREKKYFSFTVSFWFPISWFVTCDPEPSCLCYNTAVHFWGMTTLDLVNLHTIVDSLSNILFYIHWRSINDGKIHISHDEDRKNWAQTSRSGWVCHSPALSMLGMPRMVFW